MQLYHDSRFVGRVLGKQIRLGRDVLRILRILVGLPRQILLAHLGLLVLTLGLLNVHQRGLFTAIGVIRVRLGFLLYLYLLRQDYALKVGGTPVQSSNAYVAASTVYH